LLSVIYPQRIQGDSETEKGKLKEIFRQLTLEKSKKIPSTRLKTHKTTMILVVLILIGAFLRINGLDYGLPLRLHPDEGDIIEPAVRVASLERLDPGVYNRPNHVSIYLDALSFKFFSIARGLLFEIRGDVREIFATDPEPYVYLSRLLTAFLGTLMILSMYLLGKEVGGIKVGLLASSFTAFFPSFVHHSHYATPDIPLAFFVSVTALFTCKFMKSRKIKFLFLACFFCGVATAEKYPGILSASLVFFGIVFSLWHKKVDIFKFGIIAFVAYLLSLFIASPSLFINYKRVLHSLSLESSPYHLGAAGLGWYGNLVYYLNTLSNNMGLLLWLFFLMGILLFFIKFKEYRKVKPYLVVLLFGLVYWVLLSRVALHWERWAVPMYIIPIVVASVGFSTLSMLLKKNILRGSPILTILFVILISSLFFRGLFHSINFNMQDTRVVSRQWIDETLPVDSNVVADAYTPIKPGCCGSVAEKSLEEYKKEGVEFVIVSSAIYGRFYDEEFRYTEEVKFYSQLFQEEKLVQSFRATSIELGHNDLEAIFRGIKELIHYLGRQDIYMTGPEIKIYKISGSSQEQTPRMRKQAIGTYYCDEAE
jgi:hypothetical protein